MHVLQQWYHQMRSWFHEQRGPQMRERAVDLQAKEQVMKELALSAFAAEVEQAMITREKRERGQKSWFTKGDY